MNPSLVFAARLGFIVHRKEPQSLTVSDTPYPPSTSSAESDPDAQPLVITNSYGRFAQIPRTVLLADISIGAKIIYANLWDFSQGGEGNIYPSIRTLAARTKSSGRTVQRWISELVVAGFIHRAMRRRSDGSQTTNGYAILIASAALVSPPPDTGVTPPGDSGVTPKKETQEEGSTKKAIRLPASWSPTREHVERAKADGLDIDREVQKFRAHAEEHDRHAKSWNGAFTRWLITASDFRSRPVFAKPITTPSGRFADILAIDLTQLPPELRHDG